MAAGGEGMTFDSSPAFWLSTVLITFLPRAKMLYLECEVTELNHEVNDGYCIRSV